MHLDTFFSEELFYLFALAGGFVATAKKRLVALAKCAVGFGIIVFIAVVLGQVEADLVGVAVTLYLEEIFLGLESDRERDQGDENIHRYESNRYLGFERQ